MVYLWVCNSNHGVGGGGGVVPQMEEYKGLITSTQKADIQVKT